MKHIFTFEKFSLDKENLNESNQVKKEGICICVESPMSDSGLEGFNEKEEYKYQLKIDKKGKDYYKIYHDEDYAQTCGVNTFKKYFKINI